MIYKIKGKIRDGKFIPDEKDKYQNLLNNLNRQIVFLAIEPVSKLASHNLHRYYRGIVLAMIAEQTGDSKTGTHKELTRKFLGEEYNGTVYIPSTADLTNEEMWDYIQEIRHWALDFFGLDIPEPKNVKY